MPGTQAQPHALVVGGTGMLWGASLALAERGYTVSVVARRQQRLEALARAAVGLASSIHPISVDYRDTQALIAALEAAQACFGAIELALIWIHRTAPAAPLPLLPYLGQRLGGPLSARPRAAGGFCGAGQYPLPGGHPGVCARGWTLALADRCRDLCRGAGSCGGGPAAYHRGRRGTLASAALMG